MDALLHTDAPGCPLHPGLGVGVFLSRGGMDRLLRGDHPGLAHSANLLAGWETIRLLGWVRPPEELTEHERLLGADRSQPSPRSSRQGILMRYISSQKLSFIRISQKEAVEVYKRVLEHQPHNGRALLEIGMACKKAGRVDSAKSAYEYALSTGKLSRPQQELARKELLILNAAL